MKRRRLDRPALTPEVIQYMALECKVQAAMVADLSRDMCSQSSQVAKMLWQNRERGQGSTLVTTPEDCGQAVWQPLSNDTIRHVLSFLDLVEIARLSPVCKRLMHMVWTEGVPAARTLPLQYSMMQTKHMPHLLSYLSVCGSRVWNLSVARQSDEMDAVVHLTPNVRRLDLLVGFADPVKHVMTLLPRLEHLRVRALAAPERLHAVFATNAPELRHFRLGHRLSGALEMDRFCKYSWLARLRTLEICLSEVPVASIQLLCCSCPQLEDLCMNIGATHEQLTLAFVSALNAQTLRRLHLEIDIADSYQPHMNKWLLDLCVLTQLTDLSLILAAESQAATIASSIPKLLTAMPELRSFRLEGSMVSDNCEAGEVLEPTLNLGVKLEEFTVGCVDDGADDQPMTLLCRWFNAHPRVSLKTRQHMLAWTDWRLETKEDVETFNELHRPQADHFRVFCETSQALAQLLQTCPVTAQDVQINADADDWVKATEHVKCSPLLQRAERWTFADWGDVKSMPATYMTRLWSLFCSSGAGSAKTKTIYLKGLDIESWSTFWEAKGNFPLLSVQLGILENEVLQCDLVRLHDNMRPERKVCIRFTTLSDPIRRMLFMGEPLAGLQIVAPDAALWQSLRPNHMGLQDHEDGYITVGAGKWTDVKAGKVEQRLRNNECSWCRRLLHPDDLKTVSLCLNCCTERDLGYSFTRPFSGDGCEFPVDENRNGCRGDVFAIATCSDCRERLERL